jgi:radical SAM superfamily enzyme YgiQ (UPF0313 family)
LRIALVNPVARRTQGYHTIGTRIPQLGLQVLARLTPAEHTVEIIDEIFDQDRTKNYLANRGYDLIGITSYTSSATRAYELAAHCRRLGVRCIMGGPHAWARPDEAAGHFDSVAVGECDEIWPLILRDAAAEQLKPRYQGGMPELTGNLGAAAQNLQPINGRYEVSCLQTSRGCPVGCDYCSVTLYNGAKIRRRPIDEIVAEWNATTSKFVFVVDDNFFGVGPQHAAWAKELLTEIIRHGKKRLWFSQTTINMGGDAEGLRLAYQAGCRAMLVGFESFNPENLKTYHKGLNNKLLDHYREMVDGFHRGGLGVFGCFIIGGEADTENAVAETALQAVQLGVDIIQITNLTPLPGTRMYERYLAEGRIVATDYPKDWERYTFTETVYKPGGMTARRLDETIYELRHVAAREPWVWKRTLRSLLRTRSVTTAGFVHGMNRGFQRMARIQAPRDAEVFALKIENNERTRMLRRAFKFFTGPAFALPQATGGSTAGKIQGS